MREIFVLGGGGLVVCRWGELILGRRRRNRGGEGQQSLHILTFFDGFTDGNSVGEYVGDSDKKSTCHHSDLPFQTLSDSVGNLNGEPVTSLYGLSF
jgi:hypothetical protein